MVMRGSLDRTSLHLQPKCALSSSKLIWNKLGDKGNIFKNLQVPFTEMVLGNLHFTNCLTPGQSSQAPPQHPQTSEVHTAQKIGYIVP